MPVQQTSINSYKDLLDSGIIGYKQKQVFRIIAAVKNITDREMHEKLSKQYQAKILNGGARRNELVQLGYIEQDCKRICKVSGRLVIAWKAFAIKGQIGLF